MIGCKKKEDKTMKKTLFAFSAIAVLLGFTACTSDEIVEPQVSGKTILKAYTETSATRTALADDGEGGYDVVWSTGDKIFGDATGAYPGELTGAGGSTSGEFTITGDNNDIDGRTFFYGLEPNEDGVWSWPNEQTYAGNAISFSPMAGKVSITGGAASATFKNLGGLLRLNLKGTAKITSIKISANEYMSGKFKVEPSSGDAAVIDNVDTKCFKSITLDCGDGVALTSEGTQFYIAMPANTYTGVSITLTDDAGKVCIKKLSSSKNLVITRSNITPTSFTASTFMPTITASSPVGTIGMLDGREGIVVDLGGTIGKVVIATMNVGATALSGTDSFGEHYTYDKVLEALSSGEWGKGWQLPTKGEYEALINYLNFDSTLDAWVAEFGSNSVLFPISTIYDNLNNSWEDEGFYWTSTTKDEYEGNEEAYLLYLHRNSSLDWAKSTVSYPFYWKLSVRLFHAMPAAPKTYNMGDKVEFDGHEGIVVELNGTKVAVATMNVGATVVNGSDDCLGDKLPYATSYEGWSGWRLPTVDEFKTLCDVDYPACGDLGEGNGSGALMWDLDGGGIDLYSPLNDCDGSNPYDKYWTGTLDENDTEKCFYFAPEIEFDGNYSPVAYNNRDGEPYEKAVAKTNEFLVRLFHDLP